MFVYHWYEFSCFRISWSWFSYNFQLFICNYFPWKKINQKFNKKYYSHKTRRPAIANQYLIFVYVSTDVFLIFLNSILFIYILPSFVSGIHETTIHCRSFRSALRNKNYMCRKTTLLGKTFVLVSCEVLRRRDYIKVYVLKLDNLLLVFTVLGRG